MRWRPKSSNGVATFTAIRNSAIASSARRKRWPRNCERSASRCAPASPTPGSLAFCAAASRGRRSHCAPTWTPCRWPNKSTCRSSRWQRANITARKSASCMPVVTTATWRSCSARPRCWPACARSCRARSCSSSSRRKRAHRDGERGGASLMIDEGVLDIARPEAIFGLHLFSSETVGTVGYRSGPMMAGSDRFRIVVSGKQTHGARPWLGVDPIVTASQIVLGLQTIVSRQLDVSSYPAILTIGVFKSGIRNNIIPDQAELVGTFRTFDAEGARGNHPAHQAHRDADRGIGRGDGGVCAGRASESGGRQRPDADGARVARRCSAQRVRTTSSVIPYMTISEDFAHFGQRVPSFFFTVGVTPAGKDTKAAPSNHSPNSSWTKAALPSACARCWPLRSITCRARPRLPRTNRRPHHCGPRRARNARRPGRIRRLRAPRVPARTRSRGRQRDRGPIGRGTMRGRHAGSPAETRQSRARALRPRHALRPCGTTRLTRPIASASSACTARPVRIMSSARLSPIRRGRRNVPPSISGTPQRRQKTPKTASASATRRSHQAASSRPPATA